jgi:hypothetical protein
MKLTPVLQMAVRVATVINPIILKPVSPVAAEAIVKAYQPDVVI